MDPIKTDKCNFTYLGPTAEVGDLPCCRLDGVVYSYWKPTAEELAQLNAGGLIALGVWTEPIPPVSMAVESAPAPDGPKLEVIVQGQRYHLPNDLRDGPVDATDLLTAALNAHGMEGGVWEVRDSEGVLLEPTARLADHVEPFYVNPPAGVGA